MNPSSIIGLYLRMCEQHHEIMDGGSDICKRNSLQCLLSVYEKYDILKSIFNHPCLE